MLQEGLVETLEELIGEKNFSQIKSILPSHPEDLAHLITRLDLPSSKLLVFRLVPYDKAVDVFEYLSTEEEEKMLQSLSSQEIRDILNEMSPDDRTGLLNSMIHPGLLEDLKPETMVIDVKNKSVAVILRVQFKEEPTNTVFPAKRNCAIYQLVDDSNGDLKISKISYFAEPRPPEEVDMKSLMKKYREQAIS